MRDMSCRVYRTRLKQCLLAFLVHRHHQTKYAREEACREKAFLHFFFCSTVIYHYALELSENKSSPDPTNQPGAQLALAIFVLRGAVASTLIWLVGCILYTRIYTLPKSKYHRLAANSNLAVLSRLSCAIPLCPSSGAVQRAVVKSPGVSSLVRSVPARWGTGAG